MPIAVRGVGAPPCLRGFSVLGLLGWMVAFFRRLRPLQRGRVQAVVTTAHEPPVEPVAFPPRPAQPMLGLDGFMPPVRADRGYQLRKDEGEDGDVGRGLVGSVSYAFDDVVEVTAAAQAEPAALSDDRSGPSVAAPVLPDEAGTDVATLADEGDTFPTPPVEDPVVADVEDRLEPDRHLPVDDVGSVAWSGEHGPILSPTSAALKAGAFGEGSALSAALAARACDVAAYLPIELRTAASDLLAAQVTIKQAPNWVDEASGLILDTLADRPDAGSAEKPGLAGGPLDTMNDVNTEDHFTCGEEAGCVQAATERESVRLRDGGTTGAASAENIGGSREPEGLCETTPDQVAENGSLDDDALEPDIFVEAAGDLPWAVAPLAADDAGDVVQAVPQSENDRIGDVAVDLASLAANTFPVPVDPAGMRHKGDDLATLAEAAAAAGPGGSGLPDAIAAAVTRRPGQYRPRLNRSHTRRAATAATAAGGDIQSLGADLLLLIGATDWGVQLSALLRTPADSEDEIAVDQGGVETWLNQLDDQLLEPLALTDTSAAFGEPLLVTAVGLPVRWSRTSRDLHVLGPHPRVAGFASQARVVIGQESVVICREGLADAARAQILATGSADPIQIEGPNVPSGWVCWRGVRPFRPSLPVYGQSILDALDPLPAVSIELSAGIQLSRAVWLEHHPPSIRLLGMLSEADPVLMDGTPASRDEDGHWTVEAWDTPGPHTIHHGGKSASYAIEPGAGVWEWWSAWEGATRLTGALSDAGGREYFHHSVSAAFLGARPGQICGFVPSAFGISVARPDFEPVWLLTAASGTRRGSASLIGFASPPGAPVGSQMAVERWVRAVCCSGRAGAERSEERVAWNGYVTVARSHRKRRK